MIRMHCAALALALAGIATAHAADAPVTSARQPKPGCILVRGNDGAMTDLPLTLLEPHTEYRIDLKFYSDPQTQTASIPGHPLSPEAEEMGDSGSTIFRDGVLVLVSSDRKPATRLQSGAETSVAGAAASEPAVHYGSFVLAYGPQASRGLDNPDGPADGAQRKLAAQGDHVACGGLDLYINCPRANRFELTIERADAPGEQLTYAPGQSLPQALRGADPQFAPYAWLAGTLSAKDAGYLFSDGTPAPVVAPATAAQQS